MIPGFVTIIVIEVSQAWQKKIRSAQNVTDVSFFIVYVDALDLSTIDFTGIGGPPPAHKFVVSAWTDAVVKAVLAADRITNMKYGKLQVSSAFFLARHSSISMLHNMWKNPRTAIIYG